MTTGFDQSEEHAASHSLSAPQLQHFIETRKEFRMTDKTTTDHDDLGIEIFRFIPNRTLRRLNLIAIKHGMNSMTDDCPVLRDGHNVPITRALPSIDTTGWVRCLIAATPDCDKYVFLDIQSDEFENLPVHRSTLEP